MSEKTIVYADLNCPFCFALHERLISHELTGMVDWRSIEHAPYIKKGDCGYEELATVANEVLMVRQRAKEVQIITPAYRPNTRLPSLYVTELARHSEEKANLLRASLYRMLWHTGLDISSENVIAQCTKQLGLSMPRISDESQNTFKRQQREWDEGDFARRIPAMRSREGNVLLGFPSLDRAYAFFSNGAEQSTEDTHLSCEMISAQKLLVCSRDTHLIAQIETEFSVIMTDRASGIFKRVNTSLAPDVVIIDVTTNQNVGFAALRELKATPATHRIPVIIVSRRDSEEQEIRSFESSAADYVRLPCTTSVLIARLKTHCNLKRSSDLLSKIARVDGLTGLFNRREFDRRLELEWERMSRENQELSLILFDIDDFKKFNDSFGHLAGDDCLRQVAQCLNNFFNRPGDMIARFGGEEFVCLLPSTGSEGVLSIANEARQAVEQLPLTEFRLDGLSLSISAGVASDVPDKTRRFSDLLKAADDALLAAKRLGKNRVVVGTLPAVGAVPHVGYPVGIDHL